MVVSVALAADHGGYDLKSQLYSFLERGGYTVRDLGPESKDPNDDYPDFAAAVAYAVASGKSMRGIVICGSGVGACVAANKVRGIRAGICHDTYSAHQAVEHDDMNVLCLGARVIGIELAKEIISVFLAASFSEEDRHKRRLVKIQQLEKEAMG